MLKRSVLSKYAVGKYLRLDFMLNSLFVFFIFRDHLVTFYACELLSKLHQDGVPVEIEVQALFDGLQKNTVYPKTDKAFW